MKTKLTRQQIAERQNDFKHNIYEHGGSRMFIDGDSGDRELLVDTYYDEDFALYVEKCVREYFGLPKANITPIGESVK
ncbi:MAG: hypothetical protein M9949_04945 [Candidatus Kapabacteria bacterium]|nr:hypothetical protein [Candidatus Kapabacteria bacterium]